MSVEKIWVRCQVCHVELQLEDEPKALYSIPSHRGFIMNPCTGSGLTTAYHAHYVVGKEVLVPNSAKFPDATEPPASLAKLSITKAVK